MRNFWNFLHLINWPTKKKKFNTKQLFRSLWNFKFFLLIRREEEVNKQKITEYFCKQNNAKKCKNKTFYLRQPFMQHVVIDLHQLLLLADLAAAIGGWPDYFRQVLPRAHFLFTTHVAILFPVSSIHRWSSLEFLTNNKNDCFAFSALLRWAHPKKKRTCRVYFSNRRIFAALAGLGMSGRLDRCCRNSSSMFRTWRRKGNHVWYWYGIFSRFKFFMAFA